MLNKTYIKKQSQIIFIQNPIGVSSDGEKIYGMPLERKAVIQFITEDKRDVFGETEADIYFILLAEDGEIFLNSKIIYNGKEYLCKRIKEVFDFRGKKFLFEIGV